MVPMRTQGNPHSHSPAANAGPGGRAIFQQGDAGDAGDEDCPECYAVREFVNKSAASAASPVYVKFQAVIKSAASAATLRGGHGSGRLDPGHFPTFSVRWRLRNRQNFGLHQDCSSALATVGV